MWPIAGAVSDRRSLDAVKKFRGVRHMVQVAREQENVGRASAERLRCAIILMIAVAVATKVFVH